MALVDWIQTNLDKVLQAWEKNAEAVLSSDRISKEDRRDHAEAILRRIIAEMRQPQSQREQFQAAKGLNTEPKSITSAQRHGAARMRLGVDAGPMTMEFRALRMSVIQLWTDGINTADRSDLENLIRFDQALDRALTESVESFISEKSKQDRLFHTMLSSSPDASYILDINGRFIHANKAATELYKTDKDRLIGSTLSDLKLPTHDDFQEQLDLVIQTRAPLRGALHIEDTTGHGRDYEYIYTPVINEQDRVEAVLGTARDITHHRESEAQVWRHANYDPLTELPNRRLFLDRLEQQTKHSGRTEAPFALFFIDLDRFKEVNDLLGHDGGDLLLTQAAERIRNCVRQTDTVARLGGDEFTVILLDTNNLNQIEQIAQDILTELAKPFALGEELADISGSIGITRYPHDGKTPRQLLKNADQAMYAAKKNGRGQFYCFAQVLEQAAMARAQMVSELREALERQQLQLHYQPIVDLADGRITKAEALLRWSHPTKGLLLPAAFLELAEETGLISDIENWAFSEAAACSKLWNDLAGPGFQVSLNLSPVHFLHQAPKLPWSTHLKKIGLPGSGVAIEFTEKVFSHAEDGVAEKLARLEEAGIAVALDDFGTGRSSVACLKRYNVSYLKIDPSFIRGTGDSQMIVQTIIGMAQNLGLKVIAEGVETQAQRDWLKGAGCNYAQGFLFSEPVSALEFKALLDPPIESA